MGCKIVQDSIKGCDVYVYKITNIINGKCYIGISKNPYARFNTHIKNNKYPINKAIKKYGKENFTLDILCSCSDYNSVGDQERFYISYYNTMLPFGYNVSLGGGSHTCDVKEKLRSIAIERNKIYGNPMKGKHRPDLISYNISQKGKSFEERLGVAQATKAKRKMSKKRKGIKFTEDHKRKIGEANRGNKRPDLAEYNRKFKRRDKDENIYRER